MEFRRGVKSPLADDSNDCGLAFEEALSGSHVCNLRVTVMCFMYLYVTLFLHVPGPCHFDKDAIYGQGRSLWAKVSGLHDLAYIVCVCVRVSIPESLEIPF